MGATEDWGAICLLVISFLFISLSLFRDSVLFSEGFSRRRDLARETTSLLDTNSGCEFRGSGDMVKYHSVTSEP